jgi:hypothetical protein
MKYRNLIATALTAAGLLAAVSSSSAVAEPQ